MRTAIQVSISFISSSRLSEYVRTNINNVTTFNREYVYETSYVTAAVSRNIGRYLYNQNQVPRSGRCPLLLIPKDGKHI